MSDPMVDRIRETTDELLAEAEQDINGTIRFRDYEATIDLIHALDDLAKGAAAVVRSTKMRLGKILPDRYTQVGPWQVERTPAGMNRKNWRHNDMATEVVGNVMGSWQDCKVVDSDGILHPIDSLADEVKKALLGTAGVQYWKVKKLKERFGQQFDVDAYCDAEPGDPSVIIRPHVEDAE